jgi:paraquat-inducible protein B
MSQETPASPTEARIKTKRRISPFWLLPVIAADCRLADLDQL